MIHKILIWIFLIGIYGCKPIKMNNTKNNDAPKGNLFIIGGGNKSLDLVKQMVLIANINFGQYQYNQH